MVNNYKRVFTAEIMVDCKDLCKYWYRFKQLGLAGDLRHLVGIKSLVSNVKVTLPYPRDRDPDHSITITCQSQNDVKKNIGITSFKVA